METGPHIYKEAILEAVEQLEETKNALFTTIINVGMNGAYRELHELMELGEVFEFEPAMFSDTGDANVDHLMQALQAVDLAKNAIMNLNGLSPGIVQ